MDPFDVWLSSVRARLSEFKGDLAALTATGGTKDRLANLSASFEAWEKQVRLELDVKFPGPYPPDQAREYFDKWVLASQDIDSTGDRILDALGIAPAKRERPEKSLLERWIAAFGAAIGVPVAIVGVSLAAVAVLAIVLFLKR